MVGIGYTFVRSTGDVPGLPSRLSFLMELGRDTFQGT